MVSSPSKLRIAEVFASVQGEGIWTGVPSTFVRVSGCNLRCVWCDTPYASWEPEGPTVELQEIVDEVERLGHRHVVITGGEPMLFEPVEELTAKLAEGGHVLTIETAGTVERPVRCDLMSISPKLASSAPPADSGWRERHETARWRPNVVRALMAKFAYQLKIVVSEAVEADLLEIKSMLVELGGVDRERVLLMAEGTDALTLDRREAMLAQVCLEHGWRLCPRMHIRWFGNRRGT